MKNWIMYIGLLAAVPALAQEHTVLRQNAVQYEKQVGGMLRGYLGEGRVPTAEELLRVRTLENQMLTLTTLNPAAAGQLPPLYLTLVEVRDTRQVPGQVLVARLKQTGLDPLQDRLAGREVILAGAGK